MCILGYIMIMVETNNCKYVVKDTLWHNGYLLMIIFQEWEKSNTATLIPYIMLQVTAMIDAFTNCYLGQLFIDEVWHWLLQAEFSLKWEYYHFHCEIFLYQANVVKNISNTLDWYQLPVKKARSLILIIVMSNIPMTVTAANLVQLSLTTFTDVSTDNIVVHESLRKEHLYLIFPTVHISLLCDESGLTWRSFFGETKIWF